MYVFNQAERKEKQQRRKIFRGGITSGNEKKRKKKTWRSSGTYLKRCQLLFLGWKENEVMRERGKRERTPIEKEVAIFYVSENNE